MDDDIERLLIRIVGVDGCTYEGSLSSKVTTMYIGTRSDELLYNVLATQRSGEVKGRVAFVIEDRIDFERQRRICSEFAKQSKGRI